jgi:hypothetical protein
MDSSNKDNGGSRAPGPPGRGSARTEAFLSWVIGRGISPGDTKGYRKAAERIFRFAGDGPVYIEMVNELLRDRREAGAPAAELTALRKTGDAILEFIDEKASQHRMPAVKAPAPSAPPAPQPASAEPRVPVVAPRSVGTGGQPPAAPAGPAPAPAMPPARAPANKTVFGSAAMLAESGRIAPPPAAQSSAPAAQSSAPASSAPAAPRQPAAPPPPAAQSPSPQPAPPSAAPAARPDPAPRVAGAPRIKVPATKTIIATPDVMASFALPGSTAPAPPPAAPSASAPATTDSDAPAGFPDAEPAKPPAAPQPAPSPPSAAPQSVPAPRDDIGKAFDQSPSPAGPSSAPAASWAEILKSRESDAQPATQPIIDGESPSPPSGPASQAPPDNLSQTTQRVVSDETAESQSQSARPAAEAPPPAAQPAPAGETSPASQPPGESAASELPADGSSAVEAAAAAGPPAPQPVPPAAHRLPPSGSSEAPPRRSPIYAARRPAGDWSWADGTGEGPELSFEDMKNWFTSEGIQESQDAFGEVSPGRKLATLALLGSSGFFLTMILMSLFTGSFIGALVCLVLSIVCLVAPLFLLRAWAAEVRAEAARTRALAQVTDAAGGTQAALGSYLKDGWVYGVAPPGALSIEADRMVYSSQNRQAEEASDGAPAPAREQGEYRFEFPREKIERVLFDVAAGSLEIVPVSGDSDHLSIVFASRSGVAQTLRRHLYPLKRTGLLQKPKSREHPETESGSSERASTGSSERDGSSSGSSEQERSPGGSSENS